MEHTDQNGTLYFVEGPLKDVISHYYHAYHIDANGEPVTKHLSPNLEIMLIFNFGTPVFVSFGNTLPIHQVKDECIVVGPLKTMLNYELRAGADVIGINFKLNGFFRLFKIPLNNLDGETIYDPDVLNNKFCFKGLWEELSMMTDIKAKLQMINNYIATFIDENDDAVQPLLSGEHYFYNQAIHPVKAIANDAQLTERTIQIRFQKYAGYSPKELMRFLRFKMVIDRLMSEQNKDIDMFEILLTFGYHDQSHLIKDFQYFLGTTPKYFLKKLKDKEFCTSGGGPKSQDPIL